MTVKTQFRNYSRLDATFSVRIPKEMHRKYRDLSGFERKEIQFNAVRWLRKQLKGDLK